MCNWRRWVWPGLIATALLTLIAMFFHAGPIERDLAASSATAFEEANSWASVEMDGRDARLVGMAPSEEAQAAALETARNVYDVRTVADASELLPIQDPYTFGAVKGDAGVELTGFVPDDAARAAIIGEAQTTMPGIEITDSLELGRGAPEGFAALAGFGFSQLGGLSTGEIAISNTDYSVSGTAIDSATYATQVDRARDALPDGAALANLAIMPPAASGDYRLAIEKAADGAVSASGLVPDVDADSALTGELQAIAGDSGAPQTDLSYASGAPAGFSALAAYGTQQLADLSSGSAELINDQLTIRGTALDSEAFDRLIALDGAGLPDGVSLAGVLVTPPAAEGAYVWSAAKQLDGAIRLGGLAPDDETRSAINTQAGELAGDAGVSGALSVATGAPDSFQASTGFALGLLPSLSQGTVSLADETLRVNGTAADTAAFMALNDTLANAPGGLTIENGVTPPAIDGDYTFSATKGEDGTITLTGYAPSLEASAALEEAAAQANPGATITNELAIASGAPDGFDGLARFGLGQLPQLQTGSVSLTNLDYAIAGVAASPSAYDGIVGADAPAGATNATSDIAAPAVDGDYTWSATFGADGGLTLDGYAPSAEVRTAIAEQAAAALPDAQITNNLQIASGAPEGFADAAGGALAYLPALASGSVSLVETDLTVQGVARSVESLADIDGRVGNAPTGFSASASVTPPAVSGPYELVATRTDDVIELTGFAPTQAARTAIVDAASGIEGVSVVDNIALGSGAPEGVDWAAAGTFVVEGLAPVASGTAAIRGTEMSIDADVRDEAALEAANAAWDRAVPTNAELVSRQINLPLIDPYVWTAERPSREQVRISGYVPDGETGTAISERAGAIFGNKVSVETDLTVGRGAPEGFLGAAENGLLILNRLDQGSVSLNGPNLTIDGQVLTQNALAEAEGLIALPTGINSQFEVSLAPGPLEPGGLGRLEPPVCLSTLNGVLEFGDIRFASGSSEIDNQSFGVLDRLAYTARACPDTVLEIAGHTDSDGAEDSNLALSQQRALAVLDYMIANQVEPTRVTARGYGESQPIASNETPEGKARNRRIEFKLSEEQ